MRLYRKKLIRTIPEIHNFIKECEAMPVLKETAFSVADSLIALQKLKQTETLKDVLEDNEDIAFDF